MKNILSLFGILSIGASSVAPIMGNSITKNGNNNLGVKKIGITGEMTKLENQCEEAKISKYMKYSDYDTQLEKRVMYIDQWLVNMHYEWFNSPKRGEYNYESVKTFLEINIPEFKKERNEYAKDVFVKTFMTESLQYSHKKISGVYIAVVFKMAWISDIVFIQSGIFDSWRRSPLEESEKPTEQSKMYYEWYDDNVKNFKDSKTFLIMPNYHRYNDISTITSNFTWFNFPEARVHYSTHATGNHMNHNWHSDFFSTRLLNVDEEWTFKRESWRQEWGNEDFVSYFDLKVDYKVTVSKENINLVAETNANSYTPDNPGFFINTEFGDNFVLFNNKTPAEIENNYRNLEKENKERLNLPPENFRYSTGRFFVS